MKARFIAAAALAAGLTLGCARESSHGPVQWTASNPSSARGQTAAQAWSRSTSSDAPEPASKAPPITAPTPSTVPAAAGAPEQPTGVTNAQPPASRWPYDGVTLQLQ
jgi:hypothetical protein